MRCYCTNILELFLNNFGLSFQAKEVGDYHCLITKSPLTEMLMMIDMAFQCTLKYIIAILIQILQFASWYPISKKKENNDEKYIDRQRTDDIFLQFIQIFFEC